MNLNCVKIATGLMALLRQLYNIMLEFAWHQMLPFNSTFSEMAHTCNRLQACRATFHNGVVAHKLDVQQRLVPGTFLH